MRNQSPVGGVFFECIKIGRCFLDGPFLLRTHREVVDAVYHPVLPGHGRGNGLFHLLHIAHEPFPLRIPDVVFLEDPMDQFVRERGAVLAHGRAFEDNAVLDVAGEVLLLHTGFHVTRGITHLQPALMGRIPYVLIGVDGRSLGDFIPE